MNEYKEKLVSFLERHASNREKEKIKYMKSYENHLMTGALLFALNADIVTPMEEEELYEHYVK